MDEKEIKVEVSDIVGIMSTQSGRNFIQRILDYTGIDESTWNADTHEHARNSARRDVGLWIRDELINACPDKYMMMIKEKLDV